MKKIAFFCFLPFAMILLAGCLPLSPASVPTATPAAFTDPFAYCAAVGNIDQPDARYTGPKTPEAVVKALMKASGVAADMPVDVFSQGMFWRCMDGKVYGCFVGANLPCESKANVNKIPTAEMNQFCQQNPTADFLPMAVTGHDTVYNWACKNGIAVPGQQVSQVDARGYIQSIWYNITP